MVTKASNDSLFCWNVMKVGSYLLTKKFYVSLWFILVKTVKITYYTCILFFIVSYKQVYLTNLANRPPKKKKRRRAGSFKQRYWKKKEQSIEKQGNEDIDRNSWLRGKQEVSFTLSERCNLKEKEENLDVYSVLLFSGCDYISNYNDFFWFYTHVRKGTISRWIVTLGTMSQISSSSVEQVGVWPEKVFFKLHHL